jgi:hypothetical protein
LDTWRDESMKSRPCFGFFELCGWGNLGKWGISCIGRGVHREFLLQTFSFLPWNDMVPTACT